MRYCCRGHFSGHEAAIVEQPAERTTPVMRTCPSARSTSPSSSGCGRHDEQQSTATAEQIPDRLDRGAIVDDVLEHVERVHCVERHRLAVAELVGRCAHDLRERVRSELSVKGVTSSGTSRFAA